VGTLLLLFLLFVLSRDVKESDSSNDNAAKGDERDKATRLIEGSGAGRIRGGKIGDGGGDNGGGKVIKSGSPDSLKGRDHRNIRELLKVLSLKKKISYKREANRYTLLLLLFEKFSALTADNDLLLFLQQAFE
jgi:hypothetical protein